MSLWKRLDKWDVSPLLIAVFVTFDFKSGIDPDSIAPGPVRSHKKQITIDNIRPNQSTFIRPRLV